MAFSTDVFTSPSLRAEGASWGSADQQAKGAVGRIARMLSEADMPFTHAIAPGGKVSGTVESTTDDATWTALGLFIVRDVLFSTGAIAARVENEADGVEFSGANAAARTKARKAWTAERTAELESTRDTLAYVIDECDRKAEAEDRPLWTEWSGVVASYTGWLRNEMWRRQHYASFVMLAKGTGSATDRERGLFVNDPANKETVAKYATQSGAKGGKGSKGGKVNGKRAKTGLQITKDMTNPVDVLRLVSQLWGDDFEALGGPLDAVIDAAIAEMAEKAAK